jgi:hypothetical protein
MLLVARCIHFEGICCFRQWCPPNTASQLRRQKSSAPVAILSLEIMNSEMSGRCCTSVDSVICKHLKGWSQWLCSLRHELSLLAQTLESWVWIPHKTWLSVCIYSVFALSFVGSSLAMGWSPIQGVLLTVWGLRNWSETKCFMAALCSRVGATGKGSGRTTACI